MSTTDQKVSFADLGLPDQLLQPLNKAGFITATTIQAEAIPVARAGSDLIGIAQTGTGKTFAFGLPILEKLLNNDEWALILAPTRELAIQIEESLHEITIYLRNAPRTACLIGGVPIGRQMRDFERLRPRIIVATPGRLKDVLQQRLIPSLDKVSVLVLDEADRMLDMGFAPQIREVVSQTPKTRQTLLFSATMPGEVRQLANEFLVNPQEIALASAGTSNVDIEQWLCVVEQDDKFERLDQVLRTEKGSTLVFSRTKHGANRLTRMLRDAGYQAEEIHGDRTLWERRRALDGFKQGIHQILVATDVASRGIDVQGIALVLNFDLPETPEDYVHRIGRTGRAGQKGRAISFVTPQQPRELSAIERLIRKELATLDISLPRPLYARAGGGGGRGRTGGRSRFGGGGSSFGGGGYAPAAPRSGGFSRGGGRFGASSGGYGSSAPRRPDQHPDHRTDGPEVGPGFTFSKAPSQPAAPSKIRFDNPRRKGPKKFVEGGF